MIYQRVYQRLPTIYQQLAATAHLFLLPAAQPLTKRSYFLLLTVAVKLEISDIHQNIITMSNITIDELMSSVIPGEYSIQIRLNISNLILKHISHIMSDLYNSYRIISRQGTL